MIAFRRLPRDEWEAELKHYGCYPAPGMTPLNASMGEWWRYPWGGYPFLVPPDDEGWLFASDWDRILMDLFRQADERGWEFPKS